MKNGYGILQPRVSISLESASRSLFARVFSGNTGIDPYTTAASDVYQDLFGEGIYTGKGLYDVDAFERPSTIASPTRALLSHDLFESIFARPRWSVILSFSTIIPPTTTLTQSGSIAGRAAIGKSPDGCGRSGRTPQGKKATQSYFGDLSLEDSGQFAPQPAGARQSFCY